MEQLLAHLVGDYILQTERMAQYKRKSMFMAFIHAFIYTIPFVFLKISNALIVIMITHMLIDHYGIARYVCYAKNAIHDYLANAHVPSFKEHSGTGYAPNHSLGLFLVIIADNTLHLLINYFSLKYL